PTTNPCYYGVDTPQRSELLAAQMDVESMRKLIGVDTLAFLSMDGLYRAMGEEGRNAECPQHCDACFSGEYPIALTDQEGGAHSAQLSFLTEVAGKR
ncbi:MAG TPA: amidophosphoribosyltransferase, partial [Alphaproteobacteria bacterium]|nr:amidophosphoribosyltransferase [Alphaproteobacteria bacterium]